MNQTESPILDLDRPWSEYSYVAFDTETSGAYPLSADIVEVGMVKYKNGQEIAELQMLLKPRVPMTDFIIGIHGITNEMVADAPSMSEKIQEIRNFLTGSVLMAHHAPFDMGFLVADLEKYHVPIPQDPALCTSLLARQLIPESPNHKLQTLIPILKLPAGQAHRALDDARACLYLGLECLRRLSLGANGEAGEEATLRQAIAKMGKPVLWSNFSLQSSASKGSSNKFDQVIIEAILKSKDVDIVYSRGTIKNKPRRITPIGVVRNPDGDYVMAQCHIDHAQKRFYLKEITDAQMVWS